MTDTPATSRPVQALALLGAGTIGWMVARVPAMLEDRSAILSRLAAESVVTAPVAAAAAPLPVAAAVAPAAADPAAAVWPYSWPYPPQPAPPPQIIRIYMPSPPLPGAVPAPSPQAPIWSLPVSAPVPTPAPSGTGNPPKSPALAAAANPAEALATAAYARLAAQDKRGAATLFDAALAADAQAQAPDSRAKDWAAARKTLGRRWSGEAYALLRNAGTTPLGAAASPVLGGSQSGGNLAYTFNPLDRRPIAITARLNAATDAAGRTDPRTAQAAIGVRWQALRQLSISAERLVSAGELARDDWALRLAGGSDGALPGPLKARYSAYGEAGAIANGDLFIGAQGKALVPLLSWGPASISAGPGVWGSLQQAGGQSVGRLDLGPSASVRLTKGRLALEISADYRQRIAGKAEPGSGPALTLSTGF